MTVVHWLKCAMVEEIAVRGDSKEQRGKVNEQLEANGAKSSAPNGMGRAMMGSGYTRVWSTLD